MTNADDGVSEYLIYIGYGEVMRRFQTLELGLWGLLTRKIKPGTNLGQAMEMVARWDGTTFGQLMRGMKNQEHWPAGRWFDVRNSVRHRVGFRAQTHPLAGPPFLVSVPPPTDAPAPDAIGMEPLATTQPVKEKRPARRSPPAR